MPQHTKKALELRDKIVEARGIKPASAEGYLSNLRNLYADVTGDNKDNFSDIEFLKDYDDVINSINRLDKLTTQKNRLIATMVALQTEDEPDEDLINRYSDLLSKKTDTYMETMSEQQLTPSQKKNWIPYPELIGIRDHLRKSVERDGLLDKTSKLLNNHQYWKIQRLVALSSFIEHPVRNDFADMEVLTIKEYDKLTKNDRDENNYLVLYPSEKKDKDKPQELEKMEFQINNFKNVQSLGPKTLPISKQLQELIEKWLKINTSGWYLTQQDRETPLSPNGLSKFMGNMTSRYAGGRRAGCSLIRHIIISHEMRNEPTIKQIKEEEQRIENKYMHSAGMNKLYRKIDA